MSKRPSKYEHVLLDDAHDSTAATVTFESWRAAVSSSMPQASARQYLIGSFLKISGFFDRHTSALQEHSLATRQDPMTASLASTQGLSISHEHDAPLRELERTADRMFPFQSGRDYFFEMLKHANMAHALVVSTMISDAVVEATAAQQGDIRIGLVMPSPCYLLDFLALQHGARLEVSHVGPPRVNAVGADVWRTAVKTHSLRVVGDGVSLNNGAIGIVAVHLDNNGGASVAGGHHKARFVGLEGAHVKVLAFSANDVLLAAGGVNQHASPTATTSNEQDASQNVPHRKASRGGYHRTNITGLGGRGVSTTRGRGIPTPAAVSFNVDLEDLRDRVVHEARLPDPSVNVRRNASVASRLAGSGGGGGILSRDVLEPRRRLTRHTSRLIAMHQMDHPAAAVSAHNNNNNTNDASSSSDEGDVIIEGIGATAGSRPNSYELDPHRLSGEAQLSTVRMMMCFAVRVAAELPKHVPLPNYKAEDGTESSHAAPPVPIDARAALVALLVLHMLPTSKFSEVTRLASPEIAWLVVERILMHNQLCFCEAGLTAAGYALTLVEPSAMALPLWYALLVGLHHRKLLWQTAVKPEVNTDTTGGSAQMYGSFSKLWELWQTHVMQHPLLPSVFHESVWGLLDRLGVDNKPSSQQTATNRTASGTGIVKLKSEKKISLKAPPPVTQQPTSAGDISWDPKHHPPRSPTVSEASVVEVEHFLVRDEGRPHTRRTAAALALQRQLQQQQQHNRRGESEESVVSVMVEESASGRLMPLHRKRGRAASAAKGRPSVVDVWGRRRGGIKREGGDLPSPSLSDVLVHETLSKIDLEGDAKSVASSTFSMKQEEEIEDHQEEKDADTTASWVQRCHALWLYLATSATEIRPVV